MAEASFASKEDLGLAVLEEARREFFQFLTNSLQGESPLEKLSHYFDAILEKHRKAHFVGGCIFGNTALEMSDSNERFSNVIKEVFHEWTTIITDLLTEAREAGDLKQEIPPALLAKHVVTSIEGGIMMARVTKNGDDLKDCLNSLRVLLGM